MPEAKSLLHRYADYYTKNMGLRVFPCNGKTPATPHGCKDATTDPAQITEWWGGGSTYNVAIATGNGLVVLDVDTDHDAGKFGDETLADLERQYGPLPKTWTCLTGGGGVHYYFQWDDPALTVAAGFAPGLDYRGAGGYVIAPPSIHPKTGRVYEWEASSTPTSVPLAPLPDWLHRLMLQGKRDKPNKAKGKEAPGKVTEGRRNEEMFHLAASLRAKGLTVAEITAALTEANKTRCDPPLSKQEIETICQSTGRYERGPVAAVTDSIKPPDYSDAGNAAVFSRVYRDDLLYTDALGWLWWNGKRWERDEHKPMSWAMELSGEMLKEASTEHRAALLTQAEAKARYAESGCAEDSKAKEQADVEVKKAEAYLKHAKASRNAMRLKNMLELAKPALVVKADTLDANPLDLNTPIGIINLSTGKLRPHDPTAYCSQITAASPGTAGAEQWINFLDTITQHDGSIQGFLQLVAGMALFGAVYYEGVIIAYGGGRNGKSTFFNSLGATVGDYAGSIAVKLLTTDKNNQGASLATLRGKRLVITGELEEHQRLSVAMLKQLASTDRLVIEEKYHQPEVVTPSHSLVLFTNHLPRVGSVDNGTWRRLTVVPFNATIPPSESVANYGEVLAKEAGPAILAWAIQGAVNFARNGYKLDIPEAVEEITDAYRAREDWLSNFINERCIKDPNARVRTGELYSAYREWAESVGDYVRRGNDFTAAMESTGYHYTTSKGYKYWHGLRVDVAETYRSRYAATV